jgi:hypothetical protein
MWEKNNDMNHAQMRENLKIPPPQFLPTDTNYSLRWLIAIDIGTTQLYIRFKRPGSDDELSVDAYSAYDTHDGDGKIVPTDLYYPLDGSRPIWGRLIKIEQLFRKNSYDPRRLVRF